MDATDIAGLADLTSEQLREEWRRLHRSQPPRLSRDLLIRTIAYRMQELAYGGPNGTALAAKFTQLQAADAPTQGAREKPR
jgi:hypothetical protein